MRVVSWNCAGGLHKKWQYAAGFDPDVLIVPEAARPERQPASLMSAFPFAHWTGQHETKGLLALGRTPIGVAPVELTAARYVLPLEMRETRPLKILAVWTQRGSDGTYTEHLARALDLAAEWLTGDCVVVGDFNANAIWDRDHGRDITHSENVARLSRLGFESLYHAHSAEEHGQETLGTHAFRRNPANLFHIDFCFASASLRERGCSIAIPPVSDWVALSDHAPLIIDVP